MKIVSSGFVFKRSDIVAEVSVHDEDHVDSSVTWLPAAYPTLQVFKQS